MINARWLVVPAVAVAIFGSCSGEDSKPNKPLFLQREDALSTGVVISQVYGGGGNANAPYDSDFIELFNRGTTSVNISGWSIQYASSGSANGTAWSVTNLTGTIQPGHYFLVAQASGGSIGNPLPTPNATGTVSMSATSAKVALVNNQTALTIACPITTPTASVVDFVGYGTSANCSETATTTNISSTSASVRKNNGCIETDNNGSDFANGPPTPRNNLTAAYSCSAMDAGVDAGVDAGRPDAGVDAGVDAGRPDSGVDAGVDAGPSCTVVNPFPAVTTTGGYNSGFTTTFAEQRTDGGTEVLTFEVYYGAGLTVPASYTFSSSDSYGTCDLCPMLARGCTNGSQCSKTFFAQGGSASVTTATENAANGQFVGSLNAVKYVEWDFGLDEAVAGGQCFIVTTSINTSWSSPLDGGTGGGGGATGGGAGGGGGVTGGGGGATGGGAGGGGGATGGGAGGGGGSTMDGGVKDAGTGGGTGTGGGRGGFGGGSGQGGGAGGGGGTSGTDAGTDAGSMGGGSGGGTGTGGGGSTGGGGGSLFGGGTGVTGGGSGGGGAKSSGCSCSTDGGALAPLLLLALGAIRSRRRR